MKQLPLPIAPHRDDGFDSLVTGPNAQAVDHLRRCTLPGPPIYLWGAPGCGKTRLLRALADRLADPAAVGWFDATTPLPWRLGEACRLVVVDDADALDAERQHAAFARFIDAGSAGVQWAAAGRVPPVDLPLRDDLRSRLGWGHVFALAPLSEDDTRAALRAAAQRRGIRLADEVLHWLLTRQPREMGHLLRLLARVDGFALAEQRAVTVPLLKKMLAEDRPDAAFAPPCGAHEETT